MKAEPKNATDLPHVLVVDDFEDTRFLYSEYLAFAGFRTSTAEVMACLERAGR